MTNISGNASRMNGKEEVINKSVKKKVAAKKVVKKKLDVKSIIKDSEKIIKDLNSLYEQIPDKNIGDAINFVETMMIGLKKL